MSFWNFRNAVTEAVPGGGGAEGADRAPEDGILDIDGEIVAEPGWFTEGAVVAKGFRARLAGYRNVTVRINSPGGDVMAGAEIYSALREHSLNGHGRVRVEITALAASAASVIAMAGDEIAMYPTSYMMIHNPWSVAIGDAREMRKTARTLDVISEGLINAYRQRTGKTRDELKRMLENETWMSAGTCVEQGFADEVIGAGERAAACLMSGRDHGIREIMDRYGELMAGIRDEDPEEPEEEPEELAEAEEPEEPDTEETEPDGLAEAPEEPETDPEEEPEALAEEPEEPDPEEDPEEEPEEPEPEADPEDAARTAEKKAAIARRCSAMAESVGNALRWMTEGGL